MTKRLDEILEDIEIKLNELEVNRYELCTRETERSYRKGDYNAAIKYASEAIMINENEKAKNGKDVMYGLLISRAYRYRGLSHFKLGNEGQAIADLEMGIAYAVGDNEMIETLSRINRTIFERSIDRIRHVEQCSSNLSQELHSSRGEIATLNQRLREEESRSLDLENENALYRNKTEQLERQVEKLKRPTLGDRWKNLSMEMKVVIPLVITAITTVLSLGGYMLYEYEIKSDEQRAIERCEDGRTYACMTLMRKYLEGDDGIPVNHQRAREVAQYICNTDGNNECYSAVLMLERNPSSQNTQLAEELTGGICQVSDSSFDLFCESYNLLGDAEDQLNGLNVYSPSNLLSVAEMEEECLEGNPLMCCEAGQYYVSGVIVRRDIGRAEEFLREGTGAATNIPCRILELQIEQESERY